jgi:hypothetical protein
MMLGIALGAAALVALFLPVPLALALAVAAIVWSGHRLQQQGRRIAALEARLQRLDPQPEQEDAAPSVALANTSIESTPPPDNPWAEDQSRSRITPSEPVGQIEPVLAPANTDNQADEKPVRATSPG